MSRMTEPQTIPDPSSRPSGRPRAWPWVLLAIGVLLAAGIAVALVVLAASRPAETVVETKGPVVTVLIRFKGAAPEEVEGSICIPVEERLATLVGVVGIRSESRDGVYAGEVEFASGTAEAAALESVRSALEGASLPEGAGRPEVEAQAGPGDRTVLVVLSGDAAAADLLTGIRAVREILSKDSGIRRVQVIGAPREIVKVVADEERLAMFGLSADALLTAIREGLSPEPADGSLDALVLLAREGVPVYLRDVARIEKTTDVPTSAALDEAGPVVLLKVVCRAGAGTPILRGEVGDLEAALPPGVTARARLVDSSDDHLLFLHWDSPAADRLDSLPGIADRLAHSEGALEMIAWTSPTEDSRVLLRTEAPARDVAPALVALLSRLPGITLLSHPVPGRDPLTIEVEVTEGQDPAEMVEALRSMLLEIDGVEFVMTDLPPASTEARLVVDSKRAEALGLTPAAVAAQVALLMDDREIGSAGGVPVVVRFGERPLEPTDLNNMRIRMPSGSEVPLRTLASFEVAAPPAAIHHVSGRRAVTLRLVPAEGADREKVLAEAHKAVILVEEAE
jgi:multidrug efflux pump subunit AcrB